MPIIFSRHQIRMTDKQRHDMLDEYKQRTGVTYERREYEYECFPNKMSAVAIWSAWLGTLD